MIVNVLLAWLLTSLVFGALWAAAGLVATFRRWRRRRQVTRLSEFVLEDVRSRMVEGGSRSWIGGRR